MKSLRVFHRNPLAVIGFFCGLAGLLNGCLGEKIALPPVTVSFPVVQGITLGPGSGLQPGQALNGYTLIDGLTCNLPSEQDIMKEVRKQAGAAAGFIGLDKVILNRVALSSTDGDFSSLTGLFLGFVTVGAGGLIPLPLGIAADAKGFHDTVDILPVGEVDLLPILKAKRPMCGAAVVTVTGKAPEKDITVDASLQVTVYLEAGLF